MYFLLPDVVEKYHRWVRKTILWQEDSSIISSSPSLEQKFQISKGSSQVRASEVCWHHCPAAVRLPCLTFPKNTGICKQIPNFSLALSKSQRTPCPQSTLRELTTTTKIPLIWFFLPPHSLHLLWKWSIANNSHVHTQTSLWVRCLIWLLWRFQISPLGLPTGVWSKWHHHEFWFWP